MESTQLNQMLYLMLNLLYQILRWGNRKMRKIIQIWRHKKDSSKPPWKARELQPRETQGWKGRQIYRRKDFRQKVLVHRWQVDPSQLWADSIFGIGICWRSQTFWYFKLFIKEKNCRCLLVWIKLRMKKVGFSFRGLNTFNNVNVRELDVRQEVCPTFSRLPDVVEEVYTSISGNDKSINKRLSYVLCYGITMDES